MFETVPRILAGSVIAIACNTGGLQHATNQNDVGVGVGVEAEVDPGEETTPLWRPTMLEIADDVRSACSPYELPDDGTEFLHDRYDWREPGRFDGLVRCLADGPLSEADIEVTGETQAPGPSTWPEGNGRADQIAATLLDAGLPADRIRLAPLGFQQEHYVRLSVAPTYPAETEETLTRETGGAETARNEGTG